MKKAILLLSILSFGVGLFAQEKLYIHLSSRMTLGALVSETDSIYFSGDGSVTYFRIGDTLANYPTQSIDSLTFGENSNTIFITYNSTQVSVINPLAFEGVTVSTIGADVVVTSTSEMQDINYKLSGNTTDGSFKIYSSKRYNLFLNGLSITNPDGPAINIQSEKKTTVEIVDGTVNSLADGVVYAAAPIGSNGTEEDQDGAFFSEAKLIFSGSGMLTVEGNGLAKHALCSDDQIQITNGNITVTKASKDGIHAKDGLEITGGSIAVNASGDAIDGDGAYISITGGNITTTNAVADVKGITCDSTLLISGGTLNLTVSGNQSKAIKSGQAMTLSGGTITIHNSGDAVLVPSGLGYDPSYCTAIKCDSTIYITGSNITIISSGKAAKSLSSDKDIEITSGIVSITNSGTGYKYTNALGQFDCYMATCLKTDGNINILGGSLTTSSSGSAGKALSADGKLTIGNVTSTPSVSLTTTGAKVIVSGSGNNAVYAEAKTISCNSDITIENGTVNIASADDGIKSGTAITINNGTVNINNSIEGMEAPFITINGGNVSIKSSDDCFNATFGNGGETNDGSLLKLNQGYIVVNTTGGDGLDSNGNMIINGGTVIVHGPPSSPEVGVDYNGYFNVNGGLLVVSGTNSNMTQAPSNTSAQYCILAKSSSMLSASTLFHIQNAATTDIVTFQPIRNYYSIIFSSNALTNGGSYSIYTGGTCTGTVSNGLYSGGVYSGGTLKKTFTINSIITNVSF